MFNKLFKAKALLSIAPNIVVVVGWRPIYSGRAHVKCPFESCKFWGKSIKDVDRWQGVQISGRVEGNGSCPREQLVEKVPYDSNLDGWCRSALEL